MKTTTKIKIFTLGIFYCFILLNLCSQNTIDNPLIKCIYNNGQKYQLSNGDKLLIKLKSTKLENTTNLDAGKVYSLEQVNYKQLFLKDNKFGSKVYSQEEIYSIQKVEHANLLSKNKLGNKLFYLGQIFFLVGAIFGILDYKDSKDSFAIEKHPNYLDGVVFSVIIGSILMLAGLIIKFTPGESYKFIDKEIVFEDPKCKCEYYTLP